MKTFTLSEARSAAQSGGVLNANLKPTGSTFAIEFETRNGVDDNHTIRFRLVNIKH